jgi:hypothetical protein
VAPSLGHGVPSSNIVVYNVGFSQIYTNGGMITLGSEESGGVQHVYAYKLSTFSKSNKHLLYMKSNTQRGGVINDVHVDTVTASNMGADIVLATFHYSGSGNGGPTGFNPTMSNIWVSNTTVSGTPLLLNVDGLSGNNIGPMTFTNNTWTNKTNVGSTIAYANITYSNTKFNGTEL